MFVFDSREKNHISPRKNILFQIENKNVLFAKLKEDQRACLHKESKQSKLFFFFFAFTLGHRL